MSDILVVKIGGSTLGNHDTTLEDVIALQRQGLRPVVVHGGGALISEWLTLHNVPTRFEGGLRVTDSATLRVVVAVLAGLVNKELVIGIGALGGRAFGLSGADGALLRGRIVDDALGFVGEITAVDAPLLLRLMDHGLMPVVAPIAVLEQGGLRTSQLLNVNADTAAGAIAAALSARWLVFLTDVPGVKSREGQVLSALSPQEADRLISAGVIEGGMIPKVKACLQAAATGVTSVIVDGRRAHALRHTISGETVGTVVKGA